MKNVFLFLSLLCISCITFAQQSLNPTIQKILDTKHWYMTSGFGDYYVAYMEDNTLCMTQASFNDVGETLKFKPIAGPKYRQIIDDFGKTVDITVNFSIQNHNGVDYLLINDKYEASNIQLKLSQKFCGYYKSKDGKSYYIDYQNKKSTGFATDTCQIIEYYLWNAPANVNCYIEDVPNVNDHITEFKFGTQYFYATEDNFYLYNTTNKSLTTLSRYYPTNVERYPFTATQIVNREAMNYFSKTELQIMRNEIFARHGYIFSTDAMKKHFNTQTWYKPTSKNVDAQLTTFEKLNVETIKKAEADKQ